MKRFVALLLVLACVGPQLGFVDLPGFPGPEPCPLDASESHHGGACSPFCPTCGCCRAQAFMLFSEDPGPVVEPLAGWVTETPARLTIAPPVSVWHVPLA